MIQTIYVPDVWKDLKLEFKEEISNIKIDLDLDLTLSEPKGIRNSNNPRTLKTPLPNKRIEATKRRSAKYNEKYNERIKSNKNNKKKLDNNLIHHCVIS